MAMESATKSNLTLTNRNNLSLTGIKKVKSTEPAQVVALLDNGAILISGSNLSVQKLDIKEGILEITGIVNAIRYTNQVSKKFSFKSMFK